MCLLFWSSALQDAAMQVATADVNAGSAQAQAMSEGEHFVEPSPAVRQGNCRMIHLS